jgi:zinc-finger of transposase IS204/IS1001/IS1096/IS1165
VPRVERQELQGFHTYADRYGTFLAWLLIEDHPRWSRWSKLRSLGLDTLDARHLMVAILARSDVFLTWDPACDTPARHVHSRDTRTLADLPWGGYGITWRLRVRRLFCRCSTGPRRCMSQPVLL